MADETVTAIDDVLAAEREAQEELRKEFGKAAVNKIKTSLRRIADAKKIVANLELEHEAMLANMRAEAKGL